MSAFDLYQRFLGMGYSQAEALDHTLSVTMFAREVLLTEREEDEAAILADFKQQLAAYPTAEVDS